MWALIQALVSVLLATSKTNIVTDLCLLGDILRLRRRVRRSDASRRTRSGFQLARAAVKVARHQFSDNSVVLFVAGCSVPYGFDYCRVHQALRFSPSQHKPNARPLCEPKVRESGQPLNCAVSF